MATNTEPQWYRDLMVTNTKPAPQSNGIVLLTHDHGEMLRVADDGFYVRGVKVPQDEKEAEAVYECFKEWLTWSTLNRT